MFQSISKNNTIKDDSNNLKRKQTIFSDSLNNIADDLSQKILNHKKHVTKVIKKKHVVGGTKLYPNRKV